MFSNERPPRPCAGEDKAQDIPDELWSIVEQCWGQEPAERPNIASVVKELGAAI